MARNFLLSIIFFNVLAFSGFTQSNRKIIPFSSNWQFCNQEDFAASQNNLPDTKGFLFTAAGKL